jgi:hypothetical protein
MFNQQPSNAYSYDGHQEPKKEKVKFYRYPQRNDKVKYNYNEKENPPLKEYLEHIKA